MLTTTLLTSSNVAEGVSDIAYSISPSLIFGGEYNYEINFGNGQSISGSLLAE